MKKHSLHMYDIYETFYKWAENSLAFAQYCTEVYGTDFTQDGYSDLDEINALIKKASICTGRAVLDIGCGDGGMCEYIHRQTGAAVYGFDYSETAISRAQRRGIGSFEVGLIGKKEYPPASFDAALSVDTVYFAKDCKELLRQMYSCLKPGGVVVIMYSAFRRFEDHISSDDTKLAIAFRRAGYVYEATDYTDNFYRLMTRKHKIAKRMEAEFLREGLDTLHAGLLTDSIDPATSFSEFVQNHARYMYVMNKNTENSCGENSEV